MKKANQLTSSSGLGTLQRPKFAAGLLLEDDDLNAGVSYTYNLTRLLFKSLFGCGVICGLKVTAETTCNGSKLQISVAKGIALDCMGNPLEVPSDQTFLYTPKDCLDFPATIWVVVCYVEKCCRPKDVSCSSDDAQPQLTRVRSGYEIKLYDNVPGCACRCVTPNDPKPTETKDDCCSDSDEKAAAATDASNQETQTPDDPCPCYSAHFKGDCECDCDCGCACVVLGWIDMSQTTTTISGDQAVTGKNQTLNVNSDNVRRVRPVLNGYLACLLDQQKTIPGTEDPKVVVATKGQRNNLAVRGNPKGL